MSSTALSRKDVARGHRDRGDTQLVAIFPGSFKPPHSSHIHAIRYLLDDVRVSKVVVVVSNRCRQIPGTDLVLDANTAVQLFKTMLRISAIPPDRVELNIAPHRATSESLRYMDRVPKHTSLLYCVGQEDHDAGDDRFSKVRSLAVHRDISARIQILPTTRDNVHSSELRYHLARSNRGLRDYLRCLPPDLSLRDKIGLWEYCREQLKPISEIVRPKIIKVLQSQYGSLCSRLSVRNASTIDPVFEFTGKKHAPLVVKYAGDTTSKGMFGDRFTQKPARCISVEKRATRYLSSQLSYSIFPTRVDFFDRDRRILVLSGRPVAATCFAAHVSKGQFDRDVARKSGEVLAKIHGCPVPGKGFWCDSKTDESHWFSLVSGLVSRAEQAAEEMELVDIPLDCTEAMAAAAGPVVLHLRFTPDSLWCENGNVTFENLECASNFGDRAFDIASMIASYLVAGVQHCSLADCRAAIQEFKFAYYDNSSIIDNSLPGRVARYAAYQMLSAALFDGRRKHTNAYRNCIKYLLKKSVLTT